MLGQLGGAHLRPLGAGYSCQGLQTPISTASPSLFKGPYDFGQGPSPSADTGRRSVHTVAERRNNEGEFNQSASRVLLKIFSGAEKRRRVSSRLGPQRSKPVYEGASFQNVADKAHYSVHRTERVVRHYRSEGCIFSRPHLAGSQAFPPLCFPRASIPVQSASVWPVIVTKGIHKGGGSRSIPPSTVGAEGTPLPRRLAHCCTISQPGCVRHREGYVSCPAFGVQVEPEKVQLGAQAADGFSWARPRFRSHDGLAVPGEGSPDPSFAAPFQSWQACGDDSGPAAVGDDCVSRGGGPTRPSQSPTSPEVAQCIPPRSQTGQACQAAGLKVLPASSAAVEGPVFAGPRRPIVGPPFQEDCRDNRCLLNRLGSCLGGQDGEGSVVASMVLKPYQCVGTEGGSSCPQGSPPLYSGQTCPGEDGQHVGGLSYKSPGRNEVTSLPTGGPGAVIMGSASPGVSQGDLCAGIGEQGGRPAIQDRAPSRGVEASPTGGSSVMGSLWRGQSRPVCQSGEHSLRAVVLPDGSRGALGLGCSVRRVAGRLVVCFPSAALDPTGVASGEARVLQGSVDCTPVARETLVSRPSAAGSRIPMASASQEGSLVPSQGSDLAPQAGNVAALGLAAIEPLSQGLDEAVLETMRNARAPSTRACYDHKWKVFSSWCLANQVNPVTCSVSLVLRFLQSILDAGKAASTIRIYSVAISLHHEKVTGLPVGRHPSVTEFMKGVRRARPGRVLRAAPWDLPLVLQSLTKAPYEPLDQSDLRSLSRKTAFLLALSSAKRVGELQALSVSPDCIRWKADDTGVSLWPNPAFLPKVVKPQTVNQVLEISALHLDGADDRSALCPVRALRAYVDRTQALRGTDTQLFVCYGGKRMGLPLSKQCLSHWLVDSLCSLRWSRPAGPSECGGSLQ